ncbi:general secretion pathway protein A [gut metagenome]|uniref:General secretion pathway protein A n=1 Tax=gut metagenome TaxID=749906 RepID=J9GJ45_9ZZZZ
MSYLELLSLAREPFSNSPDPDVFYGAETHALCLNRLEIAVRLKRGMNVVLGQVGTGKSTLCRCLLKRLKESETLRAYCLFDAGATTAQTFLLELTALFDCEWDGKDLQEGIGRLQSVVYDLALVQGVNPVLLIDEGQKLTAEQMEILRVLLNFETNTQKLLQIIIFAQPEFEAKMEAMPNFRDRVNECLTLETLSEEEGMAMLSHRLRMAGGEKAVHLFTPGALRCICRAGEGRPRQLIRLAHLSLLAMILSNQTQVDTRLVKIQVLKEKKFSAWTKGIGVALVVVALLAAGGWVYVQKNKPSTTEEPVVSGDISTALESEGRQSEVNHEESSVPSTADLKDQLDPVSPTALSTIESQPSDEMPSTESVTTPAPIRPVLGEVNLQQHLPVNVIADLFYSSQSAVESIRSLNPDYELLKSQTILLPQLTFTVPKQLYRNHQLAYGDFATPEEAYRAMLAWERLDPRFVVRKGADEQLHYYVMARASFSVPERAWMWLSNQRPPKDVRPQVLPPYRADEKAYCEFH